MMWKRFFSRQARKPSGWFGRLVAARIFDKGNNAMNDRMVELVAAGDGQSILEIGFGCGNVIRDICGRVDRVSVEGIDFSGAMMAVARKRNLRHIREGRVRLVHGDFDAADYAANGFDAVCSANTVYFWPDPAATCARIHKALRPGGKVVLAFVDKSKMETMDMDMTVFRPVACAEVEHWLAQAGFASVRVHAVDDGGAQFCVTGRK
jgi:ubiquinone/menaquinone biosynthesis C-methylase UbiE